MKKIFTIIVLIIAGHCLYAQTYTAADAGSEVKFSIKNFGLSVAGSFTGLEGKIIFNPANAASATFNVSVATSSVNTGNSSRDKHLKKEDYFDATNHSKLTFVSSKVGGTAGAYTMEGLLTIKGVSKKISFPFTATPNSVGCIFKGQFKINRRDFNVGGSSWVLSDELIVSLNVSAIKQ